MVCSISWSQECDELTRIFVGNLSYQATEQDVRSAFERFGYVAGVHLPIESGTGRPRGIAFVAMPKLDDADEAITRMNGASLCGRPVVVNVARDRAPTSRTVATSRLNLL